MNENVTALVLAAGRSSRMPEHKLLLELGGLPLVRLATLEALASRASSVVVVIGHRGEEIRDALAGLQVAFAVNAAPERGLSSSLKAGIEAMSDDTAGALICLADMPEVRASDLDALIAAFEASAGAIAVPTYDGRRGNPVLWPRDLFAELTRTEGDFGGRTLLLTHMNRIVRVPIDHPGILLDVDTPEDWARLAG
jgi:molybdenum cofactor cytidylyltransferase